MLIKTILYEDGVQTTIVFDTDKPLWEQEILVVETPISGHVTACNATES